MKTVLETAREVLRGSEREWSVHALKRLLGKKKNLVEILTLYPTGGEDFRVWRTDWPVGRYFVVTHVLTDNYRKGTVFGVPFNEGVQSSPAPVAVEDAQVKGGWRHAVPEEGSWRIFNGLEYSAEELQEMTRRFFPHTNRAED